MELNGNHLGRPRNHDSAAERRLILDAALNVLRRHEYREAGVREIMDEAGIGTRSFYRHFDSKQELLFAVCKREAEAVVTLVEVRTAQAEGPLESLAIALQEYLRFSYSPKRAEIWDSVEIAKLGGAAWNEFDRSVHYTMTRPLVRAIERGVAAGTFVSGHPERDAATIFYVCLSVTYMDRSQRPATLAAAVDHVLRFVLPALRSNALAEHDR